MRWTLLAPQLTCLFPAPCSGTERCECGNTDRWTSWRGSERGTVKRRWMGKRFRGGAHVESRDGNAGVSRRDDASPDTGIWRTTAVEFQETWPLVAERRRELRHVAPLIPPPSFLPCFSLFPVCPPLFFFFFYTSPHFFGAANKLCSCQLTLKHLKLV